MSQSSDLRDVYEVVGRPPTLTKLQEFEMRQFRESGMKARECASYFGVSMATVFRVLRKQRKIFGPEKLPNGQLGRAHLTHRDS